MVTPSFLLDAIGPEWAAAGAFLWMLWEVHAPRFGFETAVSPLFELPERVESVEEKTDEVVEKVNSIDQLQTNHVQVTRANARAIDDSENVTIDATEVDKFLINEERPLVTLVEEEDTSEDAPTDD